MDYDKIDIDATIREDLNRKSIHDIEVKFKAHGTAEFKSLGKCNVDMSFDYETPVVVPAARIDHQMIVDKFKKAFESFKGVVIACVACPETVKRSIEAFEGLGLEKIGEGYSLHNGKMVEFVKHNGQFVKKDDLYLLEKAVTSEVIKPMSASFDKGCPSDFNQKSNRPKWLNRR